MAELEKVVKELTQIREDYFGGMTSYEGEVLDAAIALLKEQAGTDAVYDGDLNMTLCGNCGATLDKKYGACPNCGWKVKWE